MVSSVLALLSLNFMTTDLLMIAAAVFMAGGYGIMCSVSQAEAIQMAGPGRRGIANSTYYVGIDLGASLGSIIGGILYGSVDIDLFYIFLLLCPAVCFFSYLTFRKFDRI